MRGALKLPTKDRCGIVLWGRTRARDKELTIAAVVSNLCVCDGESDVGGRRDGRLNSITMPNGLLPVLEEELR